VVHCVGADWDHQDHTDGDNELYRRVTWPAEWRESLPWRRRWRVQ